ncbi:class I SAM-dependent methyltransferase [Mumia sp. DW29H23]|uniref:class I SAM-dependent methyltransferase n=1 Tax=Mumia sp. DW29H23 TaxID=3421241 RepID=UPI003D68E382
MAEPDFLTRTRHAYDTIAVPYAEWIRGLMAASPWDRAVLGVFAERVAGRGRVLDAGCGPGRVTAHLASLGVDAEGLDLSPAMVAIARADHPDLRFEVGSVTELPFAAESYVGVVAWYSLIHVPPEALPAAVDELARVLRPGGVMLASFQTGDTPRRRTDIGGHAVELDFFRPEVDEIVGLLDRAGLDLAATTVRSADADLDEGVRQAYVLARKRG